MIALGRFRTTFCGARRAVLAVVGIACGLLLVSGVQAADSLKITVYGGTGKIGQRIVREALNRGHQVTVVSRDPSKLTDKHDKLSVVKGDVLDSKQVAQTVAGQDVVVSSVSFRGKNPDYAGYKKAAESLVSALRSLGNKAPRLIAVGGAGSLEVAPGVLLVERIPAQYRGEVLGQKDALEYYRTISDVSWTYFSPAETIAPGERTGKFRLGGDRLVTDGKGESRISIEDYAVALIDEAEKPAHVHKRFTIGY
jgi:uncharacterized protein